MKKKINFEYLKLYYDKEKELSIQKMTLINFT